NYQGREEIFGAIAQHAMPAWNSRGQLGQSFTARVMKGEQVVDIPAEVVQVSALSMPDIALVKFRPEDEKSLTPLTLATQEPAPSEPLQVLGFGKGQLTMITHSPLLKKSLLTLRFPMGGDPGEWPGLCGSPVLNSAGEVVGTMTGAARKNETIVSHVDEAGVATLTETPADPYHTGYATRNVYLRALVGAYHNDPEQSTFPFMLGEHKIVDLEADEFVSMIILRDERMKTIFRKAIQHKFSYATIMEHLPEARYVELYIEKAWWSGAGLVEGGNILKARYVAYDLKEKEIVEEKKRRD
ncbi:MAG: serine protease, partial [Elusimicrobiaceae bacterium]|nr:serine protease [Elusimicrobiaceae bacterium]